MLLMVVLGVALRFVQEARADAAAAKLKAMISVTRPSSATASLREVPLGHLVPGDVVQLAAGDMIPADRAAALLQGPVPHPGQPDRRVVPRREVRRPGRRRRPSSPLELTNVCFLGTSVESGAATARRRRHRPHDLPRQHGPAPSSASRSQTSFDQGMSRFTWLMIRFMLVMVPLVFLINGLTKHDWKEAFFFALAVAVGLTPEMLPMIVTVCLSKGALAMSRKKVIVKRLNSIQNLGAMDVLCTDKTGTLTMDRIILETALRRGAATRTTTCWRWPTSTAISRPA